MGTCEGRTTVPLLLVLIPLEDTFQLLGKNVKHNDGYLQYQGKMNLLA